MKKILFKDTSEFSDNISHLYEHMAALFYLDKYPDANVGGIVYDFGMFMRVFSLKSIVRKYKIINKQFDRYLATSLKQMEMEDWGRYSILDREKLVHQLKMIDKIKWQDFSNVRVFEKKHNIHLRSDKLLKFVDADNDFRDVEVLVTISGISNREKMIIESISDYITNIIGSELQEDFYIRWQESKGVNGKHIFAWLMSCEKNISKEFITNAVQKAINVLRNEASSQILKDYIKTAVRSQWWQNDFIDASIPNAKMVAGSKEIVRLAQKYISSKKLFEDYGVNVVFKQLPK